MIKDALRISEDCVKEQLNNNQNPEGVYKEAYEFLKMQLEQEQSLRIINANKQISDGIKILSQNDSWPQLGSVAKHALEEKIKCMEKENPLRKHKVLDIIKFKSFILNSGLAEFKKYLTQDAIEKFNLT